MSEKKITERGFEYIEFTDKYGAKCSLQKSSSAGEDRIWFGANKIGLKKFCPGEDEPWQEIDLSNGR